MTLNECYKHVLRNCGIEKSNRKFINEVIETMEQNWNSKNIFVVEAPTGYGKSTISAAISLFSLKSDKLLKCIVAFPLRSLLEDQFCKFVGKHKLREDGEKIICEDKKSILGDIDQEFRLKIIGKRYMHNPDSRYLIKPITLTTVDTLALTLFGIPPECIDNVFKAWDGTMGGSLGHYLFSWSSVVFSNLVLDEVHLVADSTKSLSFLIALMKIASDFGQRLILMSATIPDSFKKILKDYVDSNRIEFIEFEPDRDPEFCSDRNRKKYEIELVEVEEEEKYNKIINWINENKKFSRVITVFNTVKEAVDFFEKAREELKESFDDIVLIHSGFPESEREKKVERIIKLAGKSGAKSESGKYLIISTQVIEAGIDISSNLFITDIAPANSLIQRFGRFLRYSDSNEEKFPSEYEGKIIIWYEKEKEEKQKSQSNSLYKSVYNKKLVEKTIEWLKSNMKKEDGVNLNVHLPETYGDRKGYKELLNYVYSDDAFEVDKERVRDFEGIFLHLENASLIAMEQFFEMEGSFIREGLQIPVVSKYITNIKDDKVEITSEDFVKNYVVPVSIGKFWSKAKSIDGVVIAEKSKEREKKAKLKIVKREEDKWLSSILRRVERVKSEEFFKELSKELLRYIFRKNVLAFIVDAKYDENLGLRFD